ncbi:acyl-CoA desaturase isoform X2 [Teleopsis dalmanni]|uniref:acyl-CoA desaturase isoform X2 n=1 Tax=Teleopsis dalmanni TaxID=139649 RepID=UPI0018CF2272|nr:acyl-CoA desaturase isoform X2 [Teleopsis dalmanni]
MCLSTPSPQKSNNDDTPCANVRSNHKENIPIRTNAKNGNILFRKHQKQISGVNSDSRSSTIELEYIDKLRHTEQNAVYKELCRCESKTSQRKDKDVIYEPHIRWPDLAAQSFLHFGALYGLYLLFSVKYQTLFWVIATIWISGIGITAGAHRLWSHKSYVASLSLRILLILLFTIAGQRDAYTWALDHRIHHKFSETNADPHNAKRGFFFAHVVFIPWYYWNESMWCSFWINFNFRFCCTLNVAFFVNSVAHMWGRKPYDKNISPVECPIVSFLALGEGWHNYHHVFPWDYKTGEFGSYKLNVTTGFIDLCAKLGLATGRKFVSSDMVIRRAAKCGDGTRFLCDEFAHSDQVWGYGDKDMSKEDTKELVEMLK